MLPASIAIQRGSFDFLPHSFEHHSQSSRRNGFLHAFASVKNIQLKVIAACLQEAWLYRKRKHLLESIRRMFWDWNFCAVDSNRGHLAVHAEGTANCCRGRIETAQIKRGAERMTRLTIHRWEIFSKRNPLRLPGVVEAVPRSWRSDDSRLRNKIGIVFRRDDLPMRVVITFGEADACRIEWQRK